MVWVIEVSMGDRGECGYRVVGVWSKVSVGHSPG